MSFAKVYWMQVYSSMQWQQLSKAARAILSVLLHRANENYIAFPSLPMLEADTGYALKAILRAIDELIEKKALILEQRNGARNRYILTAWKPQNDA